MAPIKNQQTRPGSRLCSLVRVAHPYEWQALRVQFLHGPLACGAMVDADLLGIPKDLGEFVVVHELVHQLVSNHGKVFKLFLDTYIPDREEKERQLQAYMVEITHLGKVDGGVFLLTPLANGWLINIVGP